MEIQVKPLEEARFVPGISSEDMVQVTTRLTRAEFGKFQAFMEGDSWERAQAAREAKLADCVRSIEVLLNTARQHLGTSGGRVCATLLASLYNGERVKFDVSDLRLLDLVLFEHAMNTMRLCYECSLEPHQFFVNGGQLFEEMIKDWGLGKKRRARR